MEQPDRADNKLRVADDGRAGRHTYRQYVRYNAIVDSLSDHLAGSDLSDSTKRKAARIEYGILLESSSLLIYLCTNFTSQWEHSLALGITPVACTT